MMDGTAGGKSGGAKFAFVIPVVHPGGKKVSDYDVVERALRETVRSYGHQDYGDVVVIVVCHRVPGWAAEVAGSVRFVEIGAHPAFQANAHDVQIDKGMKYTLGSVLAIAGEGADYVMPADGDDYVRSDLVRRMFDADLGGHDGFLVTQGYNALITVAPDSFKIAQVLRVQDFDRTCGTCRIVSAAGMTRALETLDPGVMGWIDRMTPSSDGQVVRPEPSLLDDLWTATERMSREQFGVIRVLGRHDRQGRTFDLLPVTEPLTGKACGHGNHDGTRSGGVRWSGVLGPVDAGAFIEEFGLTGGRVEPGKSEPALWAQGATYGSLNRLRRALGIRLGFENRHVESQRPQKDGVA